MVLGPVHGESYWVRYGWQSFQNTGDARMVSLGGGHPTLLGSSITPLSNPATAKFIGGHSISYAHQSRLAGMINHDILAAPFKVGDRQVNVILIHEGIYDIPDTRTLLLDFGLDGVPGTGDRGEGNGIVDEGERLDESKVSFFNQGQTGVHFSTAWEKGRWTIGLGLKGLYHTLAEHSSMGVGLDAGVLTEPWKHGKLGISVTDLTTSWQVWDNGTVERAAPRVNGGISHTYSLKTFPLSFTGMVTMEIDPAGRWLDEDFNLGEMGANLNIGLNVVYDYKIALRVGRNGRKILTGGLGLSWAHLSLDYAFQGEPIKSGLGRSHYISFAVQSQWLKKVLKKF